MRLKAGTFDGLDFDRRRLEGIVVRGYDRATGRAAAGAS